MKRVTASSKDDARKADFAYRRLTRYAESDYTIVDSLCAKLLFDMADDPDMTFEEAYNRLDSKTWANNLYPQVKERLKETLLWSSDNDTLRDSTDPWYRI